MMPYHPFRFGVVLEYTRSRQEWISKARRIEELGYSALVVPDHMDRDVAPFTAMAIAAAVTSQIRIGSFVLNNDLRHPAILAKEIATLDMLTDGRVELGLGGGYRPSNYEQTGIPFDPPGIRISRMEEALQIIKGYFTEESVTLHGKYYHVTNLQGTPRPVQKPYPPIYLGGGGKRILSIAAREANIVGLTPMSTVKGLDMSSATAQATQQKIEWIRAAAGSRLATLEISLIIFLVIPTDHREAVAQQVAGNFGLTPEQALTCPHILIGTFDEMVQQLQTLREQYGISYIKITEAHMEAFAPIVARLSGK